MSPADLPRRQDKKKTERGRNWHDSKQPYFFVYIDTGNSMPISPSKSRDLADENKNILTEWK
jgi:hypothetical protein